MTTHRDLRVVVRAAIRTQGLTQAAFAAKAGVHRARLLAWLAGRRGVSTDTLGRLLAAAGVRNISVESLNSHTARADEGGGK